MGSRQEELAKLKNGNHFTIKTAVSRLKRPKKDPWGGESTRLNRTSAQKSSIYLATVSAFIYS
jgi:hypothetical protein